MLRQISILTKLELVNIFDINVYRNTRVSSEKKKKTLMAFILVILVIAAMFYTGGLAYSLIYLEMKDLVFTYLTFLTSVIVLFFGVFKTGGILFSRSGYEVIASLPVSKTAIVFSKFIHMYIENLFVSLVIMLPGICVYGVMAKPHFPALVYGISGMFFVPLIPMSIAVFISMLIIGVSSRMKHKSLVEAVLSIAFVIMLYVFLQSVGTVEGETELSMLKTFSETLSVIFGKIYPPSIWIGNAVSNVEFIKWFLYFGVSVAFMVVCVAIVSASFETISRGLFGTSAKHNYEMREQKAGGISVALIERELRRYFSSGIYVTNTIMGPVLGTVAAVATFVAGVPTITDKIELPIFIDVYSALPMAIGTILCMMSMSSVSISMEGKNWWIVKSLPLDMRDIINAKIVTNLVILLPFYIVSEIFLMLALKPDFLGVLWTITAPAICCLFSSVFGITANLAFPLMNWDKEVSVVKQSASGMVGGIGGSLVGVIFTLAVAAVPKEYSLPCKLAFCIIMVLVTAFLYVGNIHRKLTDL